MGATTTLRTTKVTPTPRMSTTARPMAMRMLRWAVAAFVMSLSYALMQIMKLVFGSVAKSMYLCAPFQS